MPFPADGVSLVPAMRGGDRGWTVPVVTEGRESASTFLGDARTTIGLRTGRWKYVRYANGDVELYDLDADPNELQSLDGDPAYAEVEDELRTLWSAYKDCLGATCRTPLPRDLQRGPEDDAAGTWLQSTRVQERYGYWR
jgi:arylsulfatase A-like enzyme